MVKFISESIEDDESYDYKKVEKEFDLWNQLYEELQTEIILRLKQENETKGTQHILSGIGLHYVLTPFMERNGFEDSGGWWVENDKES